MPARTPKRRKITAREAADILGVTPRTVCNMVAEPRAEYLGRAKARRERAARLQLEGLRCLQIAEAMECSYRAVVCLLYDARRKGEYAAVQRELEAERPPHAGRHR